MKTLGLVVLLITLPVIANAWIINPANGHLYDSVPGYHWAEAEANAVALGGHLVTINDVAENMWVWNNLVSNWDAWIGLYQLTGSNEPSDGWVWASGEPVAYTGWIPGQPNNGGNGNEQWAMMIGNGLWDDREVNGYILGRIGIVEVDPVPEPSSFIALGTLLAPILVLRRRR